MELVRTCRTVVKPTHEELIEELRSIAHGSFFIGVNLLKKNVKNRRIEHKTIIKKHYTMGLNFQTKEKVVGAKVQSLKSVCKYKLN